MDPGESFTKTWRLRNSGTCTWNTQYDLVFDSGRAMGAPASIPLPGNVPPNSTVDLSVDMTAPTTNGTFKGNWLLRNEDGETFGIGSDASTAFWVQIRVGPTSTPEPETYKTGHIDVDQTYGVDLDEIELAPINDARDMKFTAATSTDKYLEPWNDAKLLLWSSGVPSYADCAGASLSDANIDLDDLSEGSQVCFLTTEGRYGRLEIEAISGGTSQTLTLDVRVWE